MITGPMGADVRSTVSKLLPISLFALPILATFGYLLFDRRPNLQPLFIASFCSIAFFIITAAGGNLMPSSPTIYRTELGISVAFMAGFIIVSSIEFLKFKVIKVKFKNKAGNWLSNSLSPLLGTILIFIAASIRDAMIYNENNVLGIWTDVQKDNIWTARDNFMGIHALVGYSITFIGITVLIYLSIRFKYIFNKDNAFLQ
jgi:hypothetical protein